MLMRTSYTLLPRGLFDSQAKKEKRLCLASAVIARRLTNLALTFHLGRRALHSRRHLKSAFGIPRPVVFVVSFGIVYMESGSLFWHSSRCSRGYSQPGEREDFLLPLHARIRRTFKSPKSRIFDELAQNRSFEEQHLKLLLIINIFVNVMKKGTQKPYFEHDFAIREKA